MEKQIKGVVISGRGLGKKLGYPTINVHYDGKISGVFLGKILVDGKWNNSVIHVGEKPTISNVGVFCEVYILDWHSDVKWGTDVEIELGEKIRDTKKFANTDELKEQIAKDVEFAKKTYKMEGQV